MRYVCRGEIHFARHYQTPIKQTITHREAIPGIAQPERPLKGESSARKKAKSRPSHRQVARSFRPERKLAFQLRQAAGDLSLPSFLSFARKKAQK
jgi:hypothetical protein